MSLRLKHTDRKLFKTKQKELDQGISYLVWDKFPKQLVINPESSINKRVWVAGTSSSDVWVLKEYHKPGTFSFPDGGLTVYNKKEGDVAIFLDEAIVHPSQKFKL